ncbi:MAG: hypothetical protein R3C39_13490 [Dehalococcoidia bacterium]
MDEVTFEGLLQYVRREMRNLGFGELDGRIVDDVRAADLESRTASAQLIRYLDRLRVEMTLGSEAAVRRVISAFQDVATTESGDPIDGIRIVLSDADQRLMGTGPSVDLGGGPELQDLIGDLSRLLNDLSESREVQ